MIAAAGSHPWVHGGGGSPLQGQGLSRTRAQGPAPPESNSLSSSRACPQPPGTTGRNQSGPGRVRTSTSGYTAVGSAVWASVFQSGPCRSAEPRGRRIQEEKAEWVSPASFLPQEGLGQQEALKVQPESHTRALRRDG